MNTIVPLTGAASPDASSEKARPTWIRGAAAVLTLTAAITALGVSPAHADAAAASTQSIVPVPVQSLALPAAPAVPVASKLSPLDAGLLALINGQRQASGLAPLTEVTGLDDVSAQWSLAQVAKGRYAALAQNTGVAAQTAAAGAGTASAQSLAKWYPQSVKVADVFSLFKQYPDALGKMTNPAYKYVGIRTAVADDGTSVAAVTFTTGANASQLVDPATANRPTGAITDAHQEGSTVELSGSAADADASAPLQVQLQDTLQGSAAAPATSSVVATNGTFDASLNLVGSGNHRLCATVINQGAGSDLDLGCVDAVVGGLVGGLQTVVANQASADIVGWAVDPDAPTSPVSVSVVSHGAAGDITLGQVTANVDVPTLATSFPGVGTDHGFGAALPATPGPQDICAVATTVQTGRSVALGCRSVVVTGAIVGNFDTLRQSGANLVATGWGFDQAAPTTALQATVVLTGPQGTRTVTVPAADLRPDVVRGYPTIGAAHGFSVALPALGSGLNKMCVTVVAADPISPARTFTCRTVTVS